MLGKVEVDKDGKIIKVKGFKVFDSARRDRKGFVYEKGVQYQSKAIFKSGKDENGYDLALGLEDALSYGIKDDNNKVVDFTIGEVLATGDILRSGNLESKYYGLNDLFVSSNLEVKRFLTREQVIEYGSKLAHDPRYRFLYYIQLTADEMELFWSSEVYKNIQLLNTQFGLDYEQAVKYASDYDFFKGLLDGLRIREKEENGISFSLKKGNK